MIFFNTSIIHQSLSGVIRSSICSFTLKLENVDFKTLKFEFNNHNLTSKTKVWLFWAYETQKFWLKNQNFDVNNQILTLQTKNLTLKAKILTVQTKMLTFLTLQSFDLKNQKFDLKTKILTLKS